VRGSRPAATVGLALVSLAVALGAAELLLAVVRPVAYRAPARRLSGNSWRELVHRRSSVPGLAYELAPTPRGARGPTNSYGMRDAEPLPAGAPGVLRVAVLGDSFSFGLGVERDETYPAVLEALLRATPETARRPVDVLNFGVGGYSTADEARVLEYKALAWSPDLVIVGYVLNDPETDPIQPLQSYFAEPRWWQHSQLLRLAAQAWNAFERERLGGGDYYRYLHAEQGARWQGVLRAFARLHELAAGRGIPVLLAIFPVETQSWDGYPYRDLHAQVVHAARAAGLEALDLLPAFETHAPREVPLGARDPHPTPLGHRIAARAILDRLRRDHASLLARAAG
jgi:lysophospholipase L1-like esterase